MSSCRTGRVSLVILTLAGLASMVAPARAGLFSKHNANPADRVPTLIATLRAEPDEHKRASAAEELRQYDPNTFPEIIPTLADIALRDPKPSVRLEAIQSLARLRPVSQRAGSALEQATHDDSGRVRFQARTLLWQYHLAGYRAGKTPDSSPSINTIRTEEPPLAAPPDAPPVSSFQKSIPPSATIVVMPPPASSVPPTVGYVTPVTPAAPKGNVWGAVTSPSPLPSQPGAVPLAPRPVAENPVRASVSGPRPVAESPVKAPPPGPRALPSGPAVANNGPKPLPMGPADTTKSEPILKEPPLPSPMDDGPDLSPP
jgi:HEAT repeats